MESGLETETENLLIYVIFMCIFRLCESTDNMSANKRSDIFPCNLNYILFTLRIETLLTFVLSCSHKVRA